jgi:hypothetical protein
MMRGTLCLLVVTMLAGCREVTDLGAPCTLVKRAPGSTDGGFASVPILEKEIKGSKDFISFGSAECEDRACVRDINFPRGTDENAPALGYCSRVCLPSTPNACPPKDAAHEKDPQLSLSCRALLLDQATLSAICMEDPVTCQRYFGGAQTPYFCSRGGSFDAGM